MTFSAARDFGGSLQPAIMGLSFYYYDRKIAYQQQQLIRYPHE
jgi:hypothetical protein